MAIAAGAAALDELLRNEPPPPLGPGKYARVVLEAAAPLIAAAERERIRQLAIDRDAIYSERRGGVIHQRLPFADLLTEGGQADGT
jgi:hypothetical protein